MSVKILRTYTPNSKSLTIDCSECGAEMHKDCNADETEWWWQCQNPDCDYKIPLEADGTEVDLTPIDEPRGG